jgi:hypothetical protein
VIESRVTRSFRTAFDSLPDEIQDRARRAYHLFRDHPEHPSLRFKKVAQLENVYQSASVWARALGVLEGSTVIWFWIGSHADYDRMI